MNTEVLLPDPQHVREVVREFFHPDPIKRFQVALRQERLAKG